MKEVYLDNSATTPPSYGVIEKLKQTLTENFGNPSSLHEKGFKAEKTVEATKEIISSVLGCKPQEIYFTSGGTEANNLAIFGAVNAQKRRGNKIVTTAVEHDSVLAPCKELEKQGFEVIYLKPDLKGNFIKNQISETIDQKTILVSVMMVNNEVGYYLPVEAIKQIIIQNNSPALYHIDAAQAFGKTDINCKSLGADLVSFTAHKIHGPKGIAAVFCSKNAKILPTLFGGEQQKKLRPGTLATELIAGFGTAVEESKSYCEDFKQVSALYKRTKDLLSSIDGVEINEVACPFPYILNISILGIKSETMMHYLSSNGVYVSSGSACARGKKSHVLKEMGLPKERIDSAIRLSFSKYNTEEELEYFISLIKSGINTLCKSIIINS